MVINPLKAFLFVACGAGAAAGTAYVSGALDPYLDRDRPQTPRWLRSSRSTGRPERGPRRRTATGGGKMPRPPLRRRGPRARQVGATRPEAAGRRPPGQGRRRGAEFDIVRVEPNGSIVVAGKAAPKSTVDIVNGANVLGSTKAGDGGDFAVVLEQPLKPGGHELVLRATGEDKKVVATSEETAVVSVPETKDGQVLALVERPGEPSRLIT